MIPKPRQRPKVWLVKNPLDQIKPRIIGHMDTPLGQRRLRSFPYPADRHPKIVLAVMDPEAPAIILLDGVEQFHAQIRLLRELFFQPSRKILTKTTGIDEMGFHLLVLKQVGFDCDWLIHRASPFAWPV